MCGIFFASYKPDNPIASSVRLNNELVFVHYLFSNLLYAFISISSAYFDFSFLTVVICHEAEMQICYSSLYYVIALRDITGVIFRLRLTDPSTIGMYVPIMHLGIS